MKQLATLLALLALPFAVQAQVPQSTIYARDVGGATMTLDGVLSESVWEQAETITLKWNEDAGGYSSGQQIEGNPTLVEPPDPIDATIYVLRDGNTLWLGVDAKDKSIGGNTGFFPWDGLIMAMQNRTTAAINTDPAAANRFGGGIAEFIYSYRRVAGDTTATGEPQTGLQPIPTGTFSDSVEVWDFRTTTMGTSNTDAAADTGYVMEMRIDMAALGFDFTQAGGDVAGWSVAIQDFDYPLDDTQRFQSRVFWESKWGNTFHGIGWLAGSPQVTVNSGDVGMTAVGPDLTIPRLASEAPVIDGKLDEGIWQTIAPVFSLKYKSPKVLNDFPGAGLTGIRYFRPTPAGADATAQVVDTSQADFKMFFKGDRLYVGVSVDDQALSGVSSEGGRDGFRLVFDRVDTLRASDNMPFQVRFDFSLAPGGDTLQFDGDVGTYMERYPGFLDSGVHVEGTVDDPNDVDTGYTIELSIDLKALGYDADLGNHMVYVSPGFFDGDFLQDVAASYAYRIWYGRERGGPGLPLFAYLDESTVVARESSEVPGSLTVMGAQPNPFSGETTLRYSLSQAGAVRVDVYDLLGRRVASVDAGVQGEGVQQATLDGRELAAGIYLYRVNVHTQDGAVQTAAGRFVLAR